MNASPTESGIGRQGVLPPVGGLQRSLWYGALLGTLAGARCDRASVLDIGPTVLYLAGLPVPDTMKGRVLTDCLAEEYHRDHSPRHVVGYGRRLISASGLSEEDATTIQERLEEFKALGYIN